MASPYALCMALFLLIMGLLLPYEVSSSRAGPQLGKTMFERHQEWMLQHGRVYRDAMEQEARFKIFKENVERIEAFNSDPNRRFTLAVNHFADLTDEEFRVTHASGYNRSMTRTASFSGSSVRPEFYGDYGRPRRSYFRYANVQGVPPSVDWRQKGAVTPIKYQGSCGDCFAFASIAAVEGLNAISRGQLVSLSEQEILDCDNSNYKCNGGAMEPTYDFIRDNGVSTESDYPYRGQQGYCQNAASNPAVQIGGYEDVPRYSESQMLLAVAHQPIAVAVSGGDYYFKYYNSGIMDMECSSGVNHAVAVVGYGVTDDGQKYWIVKNSWGSNWGDNGYIYIARDVGDPRGLCGIATDPSYPTM
ncbi:hypothetical protein ACET3Z_003756 [Daucus carota]